ncbi:hypothetical protein SAMN02927921_02383 [Sinomicrobium oceani]|uniref:Uncharacterized protein n=1 Tax=Sinomicrobium oceani TaxID=1150368 RepID=A0A1K1QAT9_9FLAO|nr:hypothetical protein [Sinomicrobium oceani]SFW56845.1 hypothetical protein SAMN02927921_02383 [Sinomicrobium oceani]
MKKTVFILLVSFLCLSFGSKEDSGTTENLPQEEFTVVVEGSTQYPYNNRFRLLHNGAYIDICDPGSQFYIPISDVEWVVDMGAASVRPGQEDTCTPSIGVQWDNTTPRPFVVGVYVQFTYGGQSYTAGTTYTVNP